MPLTCQVLSWEVSFLLLKFQHFKISLINNLKFILCISNGKKRRFFLKPNRLSALANVVVMS